jgi:predicted nucleotidyltransferase
MGASLDMPGLRAVLEDAPPPVFATVSGAHLYGFESPDSDVDLRGAFVMPLADRCRLRPPPETITVSRILDGMELDWVAHDVRKFALLMTRRNGYVLEQLYSPLVVHGDERLTELREIGTGCIVRHLYHHYRGFAATKRKDVERPTATAKDLLYLIRVYLSGLHVLASGRIEAHLPTMLEEHPVEGVDELIERKRTGAEHQQLAGGEWERWRALADGLEQELLAAFERSTLPDEPTSVPQLDDFVVRTSLELGG